IELLVADEVISMLDASTRIDVLNLLASLKARGLGVLFITHDLSLGNYISDKTVILRNGMIVEMGATAKVFGNPQHTYTRTLLAAVPQLHRKWEEVEAELLATPTETADSRLDAGYARAAAALETDAVDSVLVEFEADHLVRRSAAAARDTATLLAGQAA
ncbi:MAG: ABC transporter ATP-binding protein, partial [Gaiellaceae bacterium]